MGEGRRCLHVLGVYGEEKGMGVIGTARHHFVLAVPTATLKP